MKFLTTLAFGAIALMAANFATVAPAQADSFGFRAGHGGFGIYVNDYDNGYYGYRHHRRGCYTRWDYRHKWWCRRDRYRDYYDSYYNGYDSYDYPYYSYYSYPRYRSHSYPRYRYNNYRYNNYNRHWRDDGRRHRRHHNGW